MDELIEVWKNKRGLVLIAATAVMYALILTVFNEIQWDIAGIAVRPAAALPVLFGILLGPAAAWGFGIGNIAGDLTGSWSLMSVSGFLINFLYPYLSYLLWHRLMKGRELKMDRYGTGYYLLTAFIATFVCMALLAALGAVFFGRPFESKFIDYFSNNIIWTMIAGSLLSWLTFNVAVRKGLVCGKKWKV